MHACLQQTDTTTVNTLTLMHTPDEYPEAHANSMHLYTTDDPTTKHAPIHAPIHHLSSNAHAAYIYALTHIHSYDAYTYTHTPTHIHTYIHTYRERERERERPTHTNTHTHTHTAWSG